MKTEKTVRTEQRKIIKWDFKDLGLFEATIWGDKLTDFRACESGSMPSIRTENVRFLEALRDSISDLLKEL